MGKSKVTSPPHATSVADLFAAANEELIYPFPSVRLKTFPMFSNMTGGFRSNEFSILCGASGIGKTTLCANISLDLLEQGVPHFVASVETGATDFIKRLMSAKARKDWNHGDAVDVDELKTFYADHGQTFHNDKLQLSLYDNRFSVDQLMADLEWMIEKKGVKVAIIDNLNFFLEVTAASESIIEMDRVIHDLIIFSKKNPIHIIMVMHPRKTESGRVTNMFDIKGSSTAVQEAYNIFLYNRPHPQLIKEGKAEEGDREILIEKMRRRGKFVGRRLMLSTNSGTEYFEKDIV